MNKTENFHIGERVFHETLQRIGTVTFVDHVSQTLDIEFEDELESGTFQVHFIKKF